MTDQLTAEGRAWAEANASDSISARIALQGYLVVGDGHWPAAHVEAAIRLCNDRGRETRKFAVLVNVNLDWPEVVFVGEHSEAVEVASGFPDEIGTSVQAIVSSEEALEEIREGRL